MKKEGLLPEKIPMLACFRRLLFCLLLLGLLSPPCGAGDISPVPQKVHARFVDAPPIIDGRLDDPCWQPSAALTDFRQVEPVEGALPSERTHVWVVFTKDHLYVAAFCFDAEPDKIVTKTLRRDFSYAADDMFKLVFDAFNRQREAYYFAVNPVGARLDGLFGSFSRFNDQWDTVWHARADINHRGWTAEIQIPFTSLSFDPQNDVWGINFERVIRRKQEIIRWQGISAAKSITAIEGFGELHGLRDLEQGLGLQFKPFARATYRDDVTESDRDLEFKGGFDLTYRITPTLTALGTVYPDFAETDVDKRIVSLSRFPVFFPEKRDFFLQDSSLFSFGGLSPSSSPFFSRRIGLGTDGKPVDIFGGVRLTGRAGGTSLALLNVAQEKHAHVKKKNLGVARISQQVFGESSLGGIFTFGDPGSNDDAWLGGVDFNYRNSHLPGDRLLTGNVYAMFSDARQAGGSGTAFGLDIDYPNEPLDVHLFFRQWGDRFEPALGFVERVGIREYMGSMRYIWRPNTPWIRKISLGARPFFTTDLDHRLVAEDHDAPILIFETPAGDELELEYTWYRDVLDEPFAIRPDVVIPSGDYGYGQFKPSIETSNGRPLSGEFKFRLGDFYSGRRMSCQTSLSWNPSCHFSLSGSYEYSDIDLPEGSFEVNVSGLGLNLALSPDLSWTSTVQYDDFSRDVGVNSRVRWTWTPGNDIFLVLNQGWQYDRSRLHRLMSEVTLKVGATFRF